MRFYGEELLHIGVAAVVITLIAAAVCLGIHFWHSAHVKKNLNIEYGPKDK